MNEILRQLNYVIMKEFSQVFSKHLLLLLFTKIRVVFVVKSSRGIYIKIEEKLRKNRGKIDCFPTIGGDNPPVSPTNTTLTKIKLIPVSKSLCLSLSLSICLSICQSVCPSIRLWLNIFVRSSYSSFTIALEWSKVSSKLIIPFNELY